MDRRSREHSFLLRDANVEPSVLSHFMIRPSRNRGDQRPDFPAVASDLSKVFAVGRKSCRCLSKALVAGVWLQSPLDEAGLRSKPRFLIARIRAVISAVCKGRACPSR